eukprot:INCI2792.1.p1 GENE.INCI2792.1~~INCI2792.1.p1  ORF type:complete len:447 (-),score=66.37 INCI2792.1:65-1405(-)
MPTPRAAKLAAFNIFVFSLLNSFGEMFTMRLEHFASEAQQPLPDFSRKITFYSWTVCTVLCSAILGWIIDQHCVAAGTALLVTQLTTAVSMLVAVAATFAPELSVAAKFLPALSPVVLCCQILAVAQALQLKRSGSRPNRGIVAARALGLVGGFLAVGKIIGSVFAVLVVASPTLDISESSVEGMDNLRLITYLCAACIAVAAGLFWLFTPEKKVAQDRLRSSPGPQFVWQRTNTIAGVSFLALFLSKLGMHIFGSQRALIWQRDFAVSPHTMQWGLATTAAAAVFGNLVILSLCLRLRIRVTTIALCACLVQAVNLTILPFFATEPWIAFVFGAIETAFETVSNVALLAVVVLSMNNWSTRAGDQVSAVNIWVGIPIALVQCTRSVAAAAAPFVGKQGYMFGRVRGVSWTAAAFLAIAALVQCNAAALTFVFAARLVAPNPSLVV